MIVVTTNTWVSGYNEMLVSDVDWLKANSVYVNVLSPLWQQPAPVFLDIPNI